MGSKERVDTFHSLTASVQTDLTSSFWSSKGYNIRVYCSTTNALAQEWYALLGDKVPESNTSDTSYKDLFLVDVKLQ